jgi:hypothetical protein
MAPTPPTAWPLRGQVLPYALTPPLPPATLSADRVRADACLWASTWCRRGQSGRLAVDSGQPVPLDTRKRIPQTAARRQLSAAGNLAIERRRGGPITASVPPQDRRPPPIPQ